MDFTQQDLMNIVNRDRMFGNATLEEQVEFTSEQIKQPFDSGGINYFRKIKKLSVSDEQLDDICVTLFREIEDVYPGLEFDLSTYEEKHLAHVFEPCYKFFVKNINKLMYLFLREYLFNNKNRKGLVEDHMSSKLTTYPKEQYGKKEYYVLITKLNQIIKTIAEDGIKLTKFIDYIDRTDEAPLYLERVKALIDEGVIIDHDVVENMFDLMESSDARPGIINKLEIVITQDLIIPCLKENGLFDIRFTANISPDDDEDSDDDEEDDSDETE